METAPPKLSKKILIIFFRLFLILIVIELSFYGSGYVRELYHRHINQAQAEQDYSEVQSKGDNFKIVSEQYDPEAQSKQYNSEVQVQQHDSYRILVVGDSITGYGDPPSWGPMLESVLNAKSSKIKFTVIIEAQPAYTSSTILSKINDNLNSYNPNIVIAMMGANDPPSVINQTGKATVPLESLRVYKFGSYLWSSFVNRIKEDYSEHYKTSILNKNDGITNENFEEIEKALRKFIEKNPSNETTYGDLAKLYVYRYGPEDALNEANYDKSYMSTYDNIVFYYLNNNRVQDAENLFNILEEISPNRLDTAFTRIGHVLKKRGMGEEAQKYYERAAKIRSKYINSNTRANYQKLYEILNKKKIRLIAVQYPTLSVDESKILFKGDENITFVSNEENFKKELEVSRYEDIFRDRDHATFGHMTYEGNNLVAENVANAILEYLKIT